MQVTAGIPFLPAESLPDLEVSSDFDEWEELQEMEAGINEVDYIQQLDDINSLLLFIIFALGVISGLMFSKILWGRVK